MADTKHSPLTSTNAPHHGPDTIVDNENHQSFIKSSNDGLNSIYFTNIDQQKLLTIPTPINQYSRDPTAENACQQQPENGIKSSATHGQQVNSERQVFSGEKNEDAGLWLDYMFALIEQKELTPSEQRDMVAARLTGKALLWYRFNRLKIPDMQSFIHQFLLTFNAPLTKTITRTTMSKNEQDNYMGQEEILSEKESEQMEEEAMKSIINQNQNDEPLFRSSSTVKVLQSAKNEKVKVFPNFSGTENSFYWLKNLQQIGKSLQLNDQQIFELATIKLNGSAQEWFYHQDDEIDNWLSFKQAFLHAFPPPIQPTNIDYLAQLLARKQGETEPVGKFVQDINRLCLKLDDKITEQDKLQYLRRGLRPQLQHYALSITSLQDFLTIMQRHEQIEKESIINQYSSSKTSSRTGQQRNSYNQLKSYDYDYQENQNSNKIKSSDRSHKQNSYPEATARSEKDNRVCYQCNKPGHLRWDCPEYKSSQEQYHQQQHQQQQHPLQDEQQQIHQFQHPQQQQQQPPYQRSEQYQQQHFQQGGY